MNVEFIAPCSEKVLILGLNVLFSIVFFSSYHFHVIVDDGLVYLCMADEEFGKRQPYAFLEEVHSSS